MTTQKKIADGSMSDEELKLHRDLLAALGRVQHYVTGKRDHDVGWAATMEVFRRDLMTEITIRKKAGK